MMASITVEELEMAEWRRLPWSSALWVSGDTLRRTFLRIAEAASGVRGASNDDLGGVACFSVAELPFVTASIVGTFLRRIVTFLMRFVSHSRLGI
jgi:hypothetical protein